MARCGDVGMRLEMRDEMRVKMRDEMRDERVMLKSVI
jgi:hypothetical protein